MSDLTEALAWIDRVGYAATDDEAVVIALAAARKWADLEALVADGAIKPVYRTSMLSQTFAVCDVDDAEAFVVPRRIILGEEAEQ